MSDSYKAIADKIEEVIDAKVRKALKVKATTLPAQFLGSDEQGKGWVLLPGADSATPIRRSSVEAVAGDTVSVTVSNGRAVIDSNISNPSAGSSSVREVRGVASGASVAAAGAASTATAATKTARVAAEDAKTAIDYAGTASSAANSALVSAQQALGSSLKAEASAQQATSYATQASASASAARAKADEAEATAVEARESADSAQLSADEAQESALDAKESATMAAYGLSEVEKVVGTLNWIAEHGTYSPTEDEEVGGSKVYYTRSEAYSATSDESVVPGKDYYEYDPETGEYAPVENPVDEDIAGYFEVSYAYAAVMEPNAEGLPSYYELGLDESVQNYIVTHLYLANDGLHVIGSATDYSAVLSTEGMEILTPVGTSVASYGETFRIGTTDKVHLLGTSTRLAFHTQSGDIAYFGLDDNGTWTMYIDQASVTDTMRFGNYAWVKRENGNMTIKYIQEA